MAISDSWPYVKGKHGTESEKHVRLKNMAVYWLLERGYSVGDITEEYPIKREGRGATAYTDVHAESAGNAAYVECETSWHGLHSLSMGGKIPAENGEAVYIFCDKGILLVEHEQPGWSFEKISGLPMIDLRAYKE